MLAPKRPAFRIGWRMTGSHKWGSEVVIFDPKEQDIARIWIVPDDGVPFSWNNEIEARTAAVAALRDLADRIERGEQ